MTVSTLLLQKMAGDYFLLVWIFRTRFSDFYLIRVELTGMRGAAVVSWEVPNGSIFLQFTLNIRRDNMLLMGFWSPWINRKVSSD